MPKASSAFQKEEEKDKNEKKQKMQGANMQAKKVTDEWRVSDNKGQRYRASANTAPKQHRGKWDLQGHKGRHLKKQRGEAND